MAMVIGFLIPMEHYKLPLKRDERVTNEQIPRELLKGAKFQVSSSFVAAKSHFMILHLQTWSIMLRRVRLP